MAYNPSVGLINTKHGMAMVVRREKTTGTRLRIAKCLSGAIQNQAILRSIGALPLRDRCLLRLFLDRGASHGELAGVLGMSRKKVARTLDRLLSVASDPGRIALISAWSRLSPEEQRLAYLHLILEMPLREIARTGLMHRQEPDGGLGAVVRRTTLCRLMRRIERKVRRYKARSQATRPGM
jgi:hypothetical protein